MIQMNDTNVDQNVSQSEVIVENESIDSKVSENTLQSTEDIHTIEDNKPLEDSEEKPVEELSDKNTEDIKEPEHKIDETVAEDNKEVNVMNEEFVDEEGGREQIADIDAEDEYEDIDESDDECSINSGYEGEADREEEDIDPEERQQGDGEVCRQLFFYF